MTDKDLYKPASNIIKNSHANEKIYEIGKPGSKKRLIISI